MKKTILAASLALALSVGRSQTAEPEVLIYNGPQCGTHYYGVNGTDIITSFRNFLESALILYSSDKAWWGWGGQAQSRRDKFDYRPSNICAQCQHRMVTFERLDFSAMGVRAGRGLKQTLAYAKVTAGLDGSPAKWQAYYTSFFDGYEQLEFSRRRVAKTLVDEAGFYSGIESMRASGLLLFSVNGDTTQAFTQPLDNFRGEFRPDTSRDPVAERHWWLDESTGQMESFVFSIRLPALGAQPWAYVIFQNYFMCESQYTSLNGVEVPVAYAVVEGLFPRAVSQGLLPDSFAVIDEWDQNRGRQDRALGQEKFQAAYQVAEFMLFQRRNALFGKGHDPVSESAYRYGLLDGLAQGRISKIVEGKVVWSAGFSGGRPDGEYESFYPGGSRRESGSFKAGRVDGRWVSRYPGGSVESDRGYSNGVKSGSYRTYYQGGALRESYFFRSDGTKSAEFYYEDGTLMEKGEIDREDRATGVWEYKVKFSDSFWNWFSSQADAWDDGLKCGLDGAVCQMDTAARALMFRVEYRQKLEYISQTGGKGSRPMSVVDTQIKVLSW